MEEFFNLLCFIILIVWVAFLIYVDLSKWYSVPKADRKLLTKENLRLTYFVPGLAGGELFNDWMSRRLHLLLHRLDRMREDQIYEMARSRGSGGDQGGVELVGEVPSDEQDDHV